MVISLHECKKDSGSGGANSQVCRAVGFPTRWPKLREADLEVGDTAGLETCVTDLDRVKAGQGGSNQVKAGQNEKIMPIRLIDKF